MRTQDKTKLWLAAGIGAAIATRAILRKRRYYDLRGRTVLITGGSRGLGLTLAREFAGEGARLALVARDPEELERAKAELMEDGAEVFTYQGDITDKNEVDRMIHAVLKHYVQIDVLVNNAGVIEVGPLETMTLDDFEEAMQTHYWAALYTSLAVLPGMKQRGHGRIVNISSIGGKVSVPHLLPYSASKFALVGLSEGLRAELVRDGIYVTTVCPGLMRTGSHLRAQFKGQHRAEYTWFTLGGALPISSMSAPNAARQIITACKQGDPEIVLSLPAQCLALLHGLFPGATSEVMGVVNRLLPGPGGIGAHRMEGRESQSMISPSWLTSDIEQAARDNNETG